MPRQPTIPKRVLTESEREQLEILYRQHASSLYQYALYLTRNSEVASDLVSDLFLRIAERFPLYDPTRPFLTFAKRVMRNLYIDQCRKRAVKTVPLLAERD